MGCYYSLTAHLLEEPMDASSLFDQEVNAINNIGPGWVVGSLPPFPANISSVAVTTNQSSPPSPAAHAAVPTAPPPYSETGFPSPPSDMRELSADHTLPDTA